jgi:AbiV family abortive infection protein
MLVCSCPNLLQNPRPAFLRQFLATFAREELGKSITLITMFDETTKHGKPYTVKDITDKVHDHVVKQKAARISTTLNIPLDTKFSNLLQDRMKYKPNSDEYRRATNALEVALKALARQLPGIRHKARLNALYVNSDEHGKHWNVPDVSAEDAINYISDVTGDYVFFCEITDINISQHKEFTQAMPQWKERPELPPPAWPKP